MTSRRLSQTTTGKIRAIAGNRCGYCLTPQRYAIHVLEIEHIVPRGAAGTDKEENLWLECRLCNNAKGVKTHSIDPLTRRRVRLFNPRKQRWRRHFYWSRDGTKVIGVERSVAAQRLRP